MAKLWSDAPSDRLQSDDFVGHSNNEDTASKLIQSKHFFPTSNIKSTLSATATGTATCVRVVGVFRYEWSYGLPVDTIFQNAQWSYGQPIGVEQVSVAEEKDFFATATCTSTLSRIKTKYKSFSTTATGTALLSRLKEIHKTFAVISTETANIDKAITNGVFAATAVGTALLSRLKGFHKTFPVTATGTALLSRLKIKLKSFPITATGTANISRLKSRRKSFSLTATGTANISRLKSRRKSFSLTATGTALLSRLKDIHKTFAVTSTETANIDKAITNGAFAVIATITAGISRLKKIHKTFATTATGTATIQAGGGIKITYSLNYYVKRNYLITPALRYIEKVKKGPNAKLFRYIIKTIRSQTPPINLTYMVYAPLSGGTVYGARFNRMRFNRPLRETGTHTHTRYYSTQYYVRVIPSAQTYGLAYLIKRIYTNTSIGLAYDVKYLAVKYGFIYPLKYYIKKAHALGYNLTYIPRQVLSLERDLSYYIKKSYNPYKALRYILKETPSAQTYTLSYNVKITPAKSTKSLAYYVRLVRPYPLMFLQYYVKSVQKYSPLYPQIGVRLSYLLPDFDILTLTRDLRYILKTIESKQYTLAYWVKTINKSTIDAEYYIRKIQSKVADTRYIIITLPAAKTYSLTYYVHRRTTNSSIGLEYLLPTGFRTYVKRYLIRYITKIYLIKQRSLSYIIKRTPAPSTKGLTYYVKKPHIKSPAPTLQYYILRKRLISWSLRYILPQLKKKVYKIITYLVKYKKSVTPLPGLQYLVVTSHNFRYPPGIPLTYIVLGETIYIELCVHLDCPLPTPKTEYLTCVLTTNKYVSVTCSLQVPKSVTVTCRFICGV